VSLTFQCNHRCQTCDVYSNLVRDLSLDEYEKVFRSIGRGIYYLTVSGGEPFLRPDIVDICRLAKRHLDPPVLLIPTNGLMDKRVPDRCGRSSRSSGQPGDHQPVARRHRASSTTSSAASPAPGSGRSAPSPSSRRSTRPT